VSADVVVERAPGGGGVSLACLVAGPRDGRVVLCAHGFPDCARSFRAQLPALIAAGFRVVAPTMRGYFPSDVPRDGRYDAAALADDLIALGAHYSPRAPVALVGHDWGAIAAYAAAARSPDAFSHVATIAVPHLRASSARFVHPRQLRRSWYIALFQMRGVAERRLRAGGLRLIDELWRAWSPGFTPPPEELDAIKSAIAPRVEAVLGYYRAIPTGAFGDARRLLFARTRVRGLYVHGADDGCVGVELVRDVERGWQAGVRVHVLDRAGHFVHQERATEFNALLLDFLT
jgi:pimeloyl-ACP methyl ester carboxylesterase